MRAFEIIKKTLDVALALSSDFSSFVALRLRHESSLSVSVCQRGKEERKAQKRDLDACNCSCVSLTCTAYGRRLEDERKAQKSTLDACNFQLAALLAQEDSIMSSRLPEAHKQVDAAQRQLNEQVAARWVFRV
jgi:hypothetical protein